MYQSSQIGVTMHNYDNLKDSHPCFGGHKNNKGRIHLPVSPGCNIECKFCDRKINDYEQRPGVAAKLLKTEEALKVIEKALELCPDITVAGIAGPGDTLATKTALDTFRLIKISYPDLLKCMSTNGLLLYERADEIIEVGIDSLTVTVNAVNPSIQAEICNGILFHGKQYGGIEGAKILIRNQLLGIEKIARAGITVKVNTVLIPDINEQHIESIAKAVSEAGASIYNIIPLIPQHELLHIKAPDCKQIESARAKAGIYIDVFRHCQRCRADAIGIPGKIDFSTQIYFDRLAFKETFSHG